METISQWKGEFINKKKDGELFWESAMISPVIDESGKITNYVAVKEDVTERKRSQDVLRMQSEENRLMALFGELNPEPVLRFDSSGNILMSNPALAQFLGINDTGGLKLQYVIPHIGSEEIADLINGGKQKSFTSSFGKRVMTFVLHGIPKLGMGHAYGSDITKLMKAKNQTEQMHEELIQLVAMKDNLTKMIVHDIRNPLSSISLALDAMGDLPNQGVIDAETWQLIRTQIHTGHEMCEQLLDITKIETNTLEVILSPENMLGLANDVASSLKLQGAVRGVKVIVDAPDNDFSTDYRLLKRVLINLVDNAVKYSPDGTNVLLSGKHTNFGFAFTVTDNGPGIPEEHHEKVFHLFGSAESRRGIRGAGIGLAFCRAATEAIGGSISVQSSCGEGCRFTVYLPKPQD